MVVCGIAKVARAHVGGGVCGLAGCGGVDRRGENFETWPLLVIYVVTRRVLVVNRNFGGLGTVSPPKCIEDLQGGDLMWEAEGGRSCGGGVCGGGEL
ncbi:hypothetical protein Tco_0223168 [Tanacetum coccineum]